MSAVITSYSIHYTKLYDGGFAAARLADQSQDLTAGNGKADPIDRLDVADRAAPDDAFGDSEVLLEA